MIGTIFLHFIIAMIATLAFAVLFQAPKSEWGLCGVTGGVGWFVYEYLHSQQGWHLMLATIVATLALTLLSRFFAVLRKHPATVYLLSGIFPLVPGAGIYYAAFYLISGNMEMFSIKGTETVETAGAIVIGIILAMGLPQAWLNHLKKEGKESNIKHKKSAGDQKSPAFSHVAPPSVEIYFTPVVSPASGLAKTTN